MTSKLHDARTMAVAVPKRRLQNRSYRGPTVSIKMNLPTADHMELKKFAIRIGCPIQAVVLECVMMLVDYTRGAFVGKDEDGARMDALIARIIVLHTEFETGPTAEALGVSRTFVERVMSAWESERHPNVTIPEGETIDDSDAKTESITGPPN